MSKSRILLQVRMSLGDFWIAMIVGVLIDCSIIRLFDYSTIRLFDCSIVRLSKTLEFSY